jgi:RNA polymerase sigma-70 factor (ECF subfamily)
VFQAHFARLFRFLDRLTGDPDLAADLAQEAFVKLYQRGALPERVEAWLVTVALNLLRNAAATSRRRARLLTPARAEGLHGERGPAPDEAMDAADARRRVRATIDRLPARDRELLLLSAEGYGYRDIATALSLNEASVGVFLARARAAFRDLYAGGTDASD